MLVMTDNSVEAAQLDAFVNELLAENNIDRDYVNGPPSKWYSSGLPKDIPNAIDISMSILDHAGIPKKYALALLYGHLDFPYLSGLRSRYGVAIISQCISIAQRFVLGDYQVEVGTKNFGAIRGKIIARLSLKKIGTFCPYGPAKEGRPKKRLSPAKPEYQVWANATRSVFYSYDESCKEGLGYESFVFPTMAEAYDFSSWLFSEFGHGELELFVNGLGGLGIRSISKVVPIQADQLFSEVSSNT
jgi:hypothetical protein